MAQGTLGSQSAVLSAQQQQGRLTRTQRKQEQDKNRVAEFNFGEYQKEAERLRKDVFIDKEETTQSYYYVPRRYLDRDGNPNKTWRNMRSYDQSRQLHNTRSRDKVRFTKSTTTTDPFTFEEYSQEYEKLDPNVKQFFSSPQSITAEQERKKQVQRDLFQKQMLHIQDRLQSFRARLQKERERESRYNYSSDPIRRAKEIERNNKRDKDYERDVEEYEQQIREANSQLGKINQGATSNDIWSYADEKATYDRRRAETNQSNREAFNREVKTGNMDADLVKLGLDPSNVKFTQYKKAVDV